DHGDSAGYARGEQLLCRILRAPHSADISALLCRAHGRNPVGKLAQFSSGRSHAATAARSLALLLLSGELDWLVEGPMGRRELSGALLVTGGGGAVLSLLAAHNMAGSAAKHSMGRRHGCGGCGRDAFRLGDPRRWGESCRIRHD